MIRHLKKMIHTEIVSIDMEGEHAYIGYPHNREEYFVDQLNNVTYKMQEQGMWLKTITPFENKWVLVFQTK